MRLRQGAHDGVGLHELHDCDNKLGTPFRAVQQSLGSSSNARSCG